MVLKELINRVYDGKNCVRFEYTIKGERPEDDVNVMFKRRLNTETESWEVQMLIDRTSYKDTQVYNFAIDMPKANMPLPIVCETGLRYLQVLLKEETQTKAMLEFAIGTIVGGGLEYAT